MKTIYSSKTSVIPDNVEISVKSRVIVVKGPRGTLTRDFKHVSIDIQKYVDEETGKTMLKFDMWSTPRKRISSLRTISSAVENMITGVTKGFLYKMRFCYAHFPINVALNGQTIEIRNFLGERRVRYVPLLDGVKYVRTNEVKDQIELSGNDITQVSLACARISQACAVKKKDIRKFLDGIYVSSKSTVEE